MSADIVEQPSEQQKAFEARVQPNLRQVKLGSGVRQYWIERPQLIPYGLKRAFSTRLVHDEADARETLEKWISTASVPIKNSPELLEKSRKLIIWLLRQSKGLVEEIVLHSPFDPDDQTQEVVALAMTASNFVSSIVSSGAEPVDFILIMCGVGCPLFLTNGTTNNVVGHFYLAYSGQNYPKSRRVSWADAMEGIKGIEFKH
jgi:hypothetical protein